MRAYREKLCAIVIAVGAVFAAGCETGGTETWVALDTVLEYNPGTDTWAQKAPMLTPRGNCVTASCGGEIYAIGGETVIGGWQHCIARTVEAFDPASDTWERKAPVPITDCVSTFYYSLAVAGKVYVIRNPATLMYEYDPASDSWSPKVSPPVPGRCVAAGAEIYVFEQTALHKYDAVADTWSSCADVPVNYYGIAGASGNIFAVAGYDVVGESPVQMWEYDPGGDLWARKTDLPTPQIVSACPSVVDKIYVIGKENDTSSNMIVQEYDTGADTWTRKSDVPGFYGSFESFVINSVIYLFTKRGQLYEFDPVADTWTGRTGTYPETFPPVELGGKLYLIGGIRITD